MRRAGADVEIDKFGRLSLMRGSFDPAKSLLGMLVHEGCVLIKLLLRLLHCREMRDGTLVAFDMSPWQLLWFVK
jgi:hypothetical protein